MRKNAGGASRTVSLSFLDEVIQDILESWSPDSFLEKRAAKAELRAIADWVKEEEKPDPGPRVLSDRLLTRRLAEVLLHGVLNHWREKGQDGDPSAYMRVLSGLQSLPTGALPDHGGAMASRLADPDGFELVVQLGHDLRSPLASITFLAETLRSGQSGPLTDHQRVQMGLIYSASVGLNSVVDDVVDLARAGGDPLEGEPEPFSLHAILESVRGVVQPLADAKGVEFRTEVTAHDRVRGHPLAIRRILQNLVINGLKFTEHGWVEASVAPAGRDRVEFSVRDTGRGISEENMERLYQPFRRSPGREGSFFSSSGLGLAIVRRLLLAMESDLELETRPDWGTRFHFFLDLPTVTHY